MKAKPFTIVAGLLGLGLAGWLILHEGVHDILAVLEVSGWGVLWLIPLHFAPVAVDARGWQALLRPLDLQHRASFPFLAWIAAVREAVDRLLPVANLGGQLVGIRLLLLRPVRIAAATTSVFADILLNIVTRYLFTLLGLVLLIVLVHDTYATNGLIIGFVATLPLPIILYFLLRNGRLFERIKRGMPHLLGSEHHLPVMFAECATELDRDLAALLRMPRPLASALGWQLVAMMLGGVETWVALRLLGAPVSIWEAVALESLASIVRDIAFFVPSGIGVQEVSFVAFGSVFGLPADISVALSLVKRLRDIGFGVPALLSWQWVEAHSLHTGYHEHATGSRSD